MKIEKNNKVLIVDDEKEIANSLKDILEGPSKMGELLKKKAEKLFSSNKETETQSSFSFSPHVAYSGEEAVNIIEEFNNKNDSFALLLIDIKMPGMNGVDAAKKIRSIDPLIEIIFMTAFSDFTISDLNKTIGNNIAYITKPFQSEEAISLTRKSISEWNSKKEMIQMADDFLDFQNKTKNIDQFKENIFFLFKKYFQLNNSVIIDKDENGNFRTIQKQGEKAEDILSFLKKYNLEIKESKTLTNFGGFFFVPMGDVYIGFESENVIFSSSEYFFIELLSKLSKRLINELYLSNKIEVGKRLTKLGENIGSITHDIKLTLNNLMNAATEAQQSISNQQEVLNNLSYIYSTCQDFESFLWHIQETIKAPTLNKERIDSNSFIEDLKESTSFLKISYPNLFFIFHQEHEKVSFYGEIKSLKRVFLNIIQNAINSFKQNKKDSSTEKKIEFSFQKKDSHIIFLIKDNGPGIEKELQSKIFKPLSSFNSPYNIGLGTAIASDIISQHGGNITFQSTPGKTLVSITLPLENS